MFLPLMTRFVSRLPSKISTINSSIRINNAIYATYATKAPFMNNAKQFSVNKKLAIAILLFTENCLALFINGALVAYVAYIALLILIDEFIVEIFEGNRDTKRVIKGKNIFVTKKVFFRDHANFPEKFPAYRFFTHVFTSI